MTSKEMDVTRSTRIDGGRMNRTNPTRWLHLNLAVLIFLTPFFMAGFQNCAPNKFDVAADEALKPVDGFDCRNNPTSEDCIKICQDDPSKCEPVEPTPVETGDFELIDQVVNTEIGVPVTFNAEYSGDKKNYQLSFRDNGIQTSLDIPGVGAIEIINQTNYQLKFTPLAGFTGHKDIALFAIEGTAKVIDGSRITLAVGPVTPIPILKPALAVRASACVMCHADVRANVITDFGYGGDGKGRDYYFGKGVPASMSYKMFGNITWTVQYAWNSSSVYGDEKAFNVLGNWANLNLEAGKKVYVPHNAPVPQQPATMSNTSTLKEYLKSRFELSPHSGTVQAAQNGVQEYGKIFIGAPSTARLRSLFGMSAASTTLAMPFPGGATLSGMALSGGVAYNSGMVTCEGDVFINGPVLLKNLKLDTKNGCRIYSTGTIFVYGPIEYQNLSEAAYKNSNLQLSSSKAVLMGLGELWSGADPVNGVATSCESDIPKPANISHFFYLNKSERSKRDAFVLQAYPSAADLKDYDDGNWNSLFARMTFWMNGSHFYRHDNRNGWDIGKDILSEYDKVKAAPGLGRQKDAACEASKRNVSYERLLINAPQVHSRYWGDFSGVIVAEFILPALGQFHFKFDPVFMTAPILPKLEDSDYLKVE